MCNMQKFRQVIVIIFCMLTNLTMCFIRTIYVSWLETICSFLWNCQNKIQVNSSLFMMRSVFYICKYLHLWSNVNLWQAKLKFPILKKYENDWPITDLLNIHLKNTSDRRIAQRKRIETENNSVSFCGLIPHNRFTTTPSWAFTDSSCSFTAHSG